VQAIPGIDLVILFDVTSSMTPEIQAMIANLQNLITNLNSLTPNLRLGLASYRDFADYGGQPGDLPFMMNVPLTSNTAAVAASLGTLTASGGGDLPESFSTAVNAAITGNAFEPYFGASNMGWENDPTRVKIILGISDASDKATGLPPGAATLSQVAALMKSQGILFFGIGYQYQVEPYPGANEYTSYSDFAYLAQNTGAIVTSPGIDLSGTGNLSTYGDLAPGAPAVLLMTPTGQLEGAPAGADPTRVLADAITKMVQTTRPFQFNLAVDGSGRTYTPVTNSLSISAETSGQQCFTVTNFAPLNAAAACGVNSPVTLSVTESSTNSVVSNANYVASISVDESCMAAPTSSSTATSTSTGTSTASSNWTIQGFDGTMTTTSATVIWQTIGAATTAVLHVGLRADQLDSQIINVTPAATTQTVVVSGLIPATTYYFQVDATDSNGTVVQSTVISKTTK
jgi:hypothetical protein